jgi:hypothetical protein
MWRLKRVSEEGWVGFENFIRQYRDLHGILLKKKNFGKIWIVWGGWESRLMCSSSEWPTYRMTGSGHSMRQARIESRVENICGVTNGRLETRS